MNATLFVRLFAIAAGFIAAVTLAELPFLEPTREEWERMTPVERTIAQEKLTREWARQRAESTKLQEDQKSGICHVHQIKMELRTVEIHYGLPVADSSQTPIPRAWLPKLLAATAAEFPNADDLSAGGCVVSADSPKTRKVYMCPNCVEAKRKFMAEIHSK